MNLVLGGKDVQNKSLQQCPKEKCLSFVQGLIGPCLFILKPSTDNILLLLYYCLDPTSKGHITFQGRRTRMRVLYTPPFPSLPPFLFYYSGINAPVNLSLIGSSERFFCSFANAFDRPRKVLHSLFSQLRIHRFTDSRSIL